LDGQCLQDQTIVIASRNWPCYNTKHLARTLTVLLRAEAYPHGLNNIIDFTGNVIIGAEQ